MSIHPPPRNQLLSNLLVLRRQDPNVYPLHRVLHPVFQLQQTVRTVRLVQEVVEEVVAAVFIPPHVLDGHPQPLLFLWLVILAV